MIRLLILDDDQTYLSLVRRAIKLENLESQAVCVSNVSQFPPSVCGSPNQHRGVAAGHQLARR